eukprot:10972027-Ditylum_brightwellii.AAC.1
MAKDGIPVFVNQDNLPNYWSSVRLPQEPSQRCLVRNKLTKVWEQQYMEDMPIKSMTSYFEVNKGTDDIRM